jgi:hypothetical protein
MPSRRSRLRSLHGANLDRADPLIGPAAMTLVRRRLGPSPKIHEVAGDASTRRFYRIRTGRKSAILMVHPEPLAPSSPLYSNHRVLRSIGAPVPRILGSDNRSGLVLVDDFGDTTLQKLLLGETGSGGPRPAARDLYRRACDLIILMSRKGARVLRPDDFAARNALDRERFLFELDHFHTHFIGALRGLKPSGPDEALLRAFYADLAEDCDRMPRVFCHRDFQSRNLMVTKGRLRMIDFQDARMGPYTYDAASLLRDSSLDLGEDLVREMIDYLVAGLEAGPEEFRRDFDRMALQRNVKDLGTFGYMATARGLRSYLEYVPRTIRSIRRTLLSGGRYHLAFPALERYVLSY